MDRDRRSVLAALGLAIPFGMGNRLFAATPPSFTPPDLRFSPLEDAVRSAFDSGGGSVRRFEVGHAPVVELGVQGCHNDRPFAGFAAGRLRIVSTGCEPGPVCGGVRLYLATLDVALDSDRGESGRPLDFALLPPVLTVLDRSPVAPELVGARRGA
jgi:hypothetical protein